jgi:hypothetical protein
MAGVKITDLETITEAASNDLLYIVDVSNTTESPQGTSSQIELGNILSSGTYTPTFSGEINLNALPNSATYIKVGNIVTVSAQIEINFDAGEDDGNFEMSLPVASNFTSNKNLYGIMQFSFGSGSVLEIIALDIFAEATNNTCAVAIGVTTPELSMQYCTIQFQYEIL